MIRPAQRSSLFPFPILFFFFFNDTATTEIYTLSLHDALPISAVLTHSPALLAAGIPIATAAKGIQLMNRMIRSPVLRNHYLEVLSAAAQQNAGAMNRALEKFDRSEEHTSELQSHSDLVCRLLL